MAPGRIGARTGKAISENSLKAWPRPYGALIRKEEKVNKQELQQQYERLAKANQATQKEMEELANKINKLDEENTCWKPGFSKGYYFISVEGEVLRDIWSGGDIDQHRYSMGNVHQTEEQAEKYKKKSYVLQRLKELTKGFKPDWNNRNQPKFCIYYSGEYGRFHVDHWYRANYGGVHFKTKQDAVDAIEILGSDLNILFE